MASDQKKKSTKHSVQAKWKKLIFDQFFVFLYFTVFFLTAVIIAFLSDCSQVLYFYIAVGAMHIAAALSAAFFAKREKKNGLLVGIKTTALSNIIFLTAALVCCGFQPDFRLLISAVILFLSAALGGIIGVNIQTKTKLPQRKGMHK